ncbi:MAG: cupin domain-containing protein [Myxococcales bacterium]|nr:cupin domain-containing protein [Myxococcales bacterium]
MFFETNLAPNAPRHARGEKLSISAASKRATITGAKAYFTGKVKVAMLFAPQGPRTFSGASVSFEPGARSAWHSHPAGQTLVVTAGAGWVQMQGQPRRDLKPGDVVWTPPGVRHWHGATDSSAMTHLALQGAVDGKAVNWFEHVSDAQYAARQARASR